MYGNVLLSFVKGSKSADGGKNPLADMDPGGPNPLADMDRGSPYPLADLDRGVVGTMVGQWLQHSLPSTLRGGLSLILFLGHLCKLLVFS